MAKKSQKNFYIFGFAVIFIMIGIIYFIFVIFSKETQSLNIEDLGIPMEDQTIQGVDEFQNIEIFVPDSENKMLIKQNRAIAKTNNIKGLAVQIFEMVKNRSNGLIPNDAKITNAFLSEGIVYLNFNDSIKKIPLGNEKEALAVYSIVNSITSIQGVRKVKILVNDIEVDSFGGNIDMINYFEKDENLLLKGE